MSLTSIRTLNEQRDTHALPICPSCHVIPGMRMCVCRQPPSEDDVVVVALLLSVFVLSFFCG